MGSGFPESSPAKADLKAATADEVELACGAQFLMQFGETVKHIILWTENSFCKPSFMRLGPGRLKHLEASQLHAREGSGHSIQRT